MDRLARLNSSFLSSVIKVVLAREQDGDDGGGVGRTGTDDDKFIFLHGKGLLSRGKRFR